MSDEPKVVKVRPVLAPGSGDLRTVRFGSAAAPAPATPSDPPKPAWDGQAASQEESGLSSRRIWERPAKELLSYLRRGGVEVQSPEAAVLLGDLIAALEDVEIPERYR